MYRAHKQEKTISDSKEPQSAGWMNTKKLSVTQSRIWTRVTTLTQSKQHVCVRNFVQVEYVVSFSSPLSGIAEFYFFYCQFYFLFLYMYVQRELWWTKVIVCVLMPSLLTSVSLFVSLYFILL